MKLPLDKPAPDIDRFVRVIRGEEAPARPPLAELDAEREAIAATARLAEAQASVQTAAWRLRLLCGIE